MIEKEEDLLKLQKILRDKNPNLSNEEIVQISNQFYELAVLIVRLQIEQHLKTSKTDKAGVLGVESDKPP